MFRDIFYSIIDKITGNQQYTDVEHRLFNLSLFISTLVALSCLTINYFLITNVTKIAVSIFGFVFCLLLYYLSRFNNKRLIWLYIITVSLLLSSAWVLSDGPNGAVNYIYILALLIFLSITQRRQHMLVMAIVVINIAVLYYIFFFYPHLIQHNNNEMLRQRDIIYVYLFTLLFSVFLFSTLRFNFEEEKYEVEVQKTEIELQHQYMKDSIFYARDIQKGFLQDTKKIEQYFKNVTCLWLPKDIVSGDFYIFRRFENNPDKIFIAVGDCTGHGVPGALITMLGISFIKEIFLQDQNIKANELLNRLRDMMKDALSQGRKASENRDGMDMAVCIVDKKMKLLEFAGSNRPLIIIRDSGIIELKGDRMPIGVHVNDNQSFTSQTFNLHINDKVYMFTDGYVDQYGGEQCKKMYISKFKSLLLDINQLPMTDQYKLFVDNFYSWKGEQEQTDDVLVVGFDPLS